MQAQTFPKKLNEAQLLPLKLFSRDLSSKDMEALKRLLVDFYDRLAQEELERLQQNKSITQDDLDRLQETHPRRTPYPK
ncbi:MAG: hypothetical protein RMJ33_14690 [Saprospiraceae bacterium]|nr:hypothetical protein [Saprospiraceae bacterium]MDW8231077.1 hypothetical protein [Saprospiraceae bacterium]